MSSRVQPNRIGRIIASRAELLPPSLNVFDGIAAKADYKYASIGSAPSVPESFFK